ncbi:hypothetical protein PC118_g22585 [Phytophthora cactorum]|uniref:Uncharacterized protein n=1 Tax=Phytophthora cactorum TaxID=29920 RepID=A0A8T1AVR7_9STRA|nr:hypothetical protein PC114_g23837 [Phytophthora cactorum]KAG2888104.1 hypothetical protein PC117_g25011 [Phytophthora cactorum]KAG2960318.1 hypothetical protein PC118_g22585 [Phytophthora cactorum]
MDMRQLVVRYVDEQLAAEEEGGEQEQVTDNKGLYVLLPNHVSQKTRGFQNPACYTPPSSELIEQGRLRIGCQFGRDLVAPGAQAIQVGVVDVRRQHTT